MIRSDYILFISLYSSTFPLMQYTSREVYEFIAHQTNDPIVERKNCAVSGTQFPIYQSDLEFYSKISPSFAGNTFLIPTPTLCPEERQRRRLSFRNERKLYRRQCDASKKSIISIYSPDKPFKVYDQHIRWSDSRDPMDYGREFDFSKTFTENFRELMREVPRRWIINTSTNENSPYTNFTDSSKNIYMCSDVYHCENTFYSHTIKYLKSCFDNLDIKNSEESFECSFSKNLYNCKYVISSENCINSSYLSNCRNIENCIYCVWLSNKKYHIFNQPVSVENFNLFKSKIWKWDFLSMKTYEELLQKQIKSNRIINGDKIIWNNIYDSNNLTLCFEVDTAQNSKYIFVWYWIDTCMDTSVHNIDCEYDYEAISWWKLKYSSYNILWRGWEKLLYTQECVDSSNLFWCIWLRNKQYCIFNKQYTKEEYEKEVAKIITHMQSTWERGEFFHPSLSPFWYNETVAQEYYPLSEQTAPASWFTRSTYSSDPTIPEWVPTIKRENYTDAQRNELLQSDNLESLIFICSVSHRPFRLQKAEIEFYRKHHLPIPHKHPDIRHQERMKLRPWRTLYLRTCDCCSKETLSVYPADHQGKVYCEACYQKEVFA